MAFIFEIVENLDLLYNITFTVELKYICGYLYLSCRLIEWLLLWMGRQKSGAPLLNVPKHQH